MKKHRYDLILLAVLLLAAAGAWLLLRPASGRGGWVVITQDGRETGRYPLSQNRTVLIGEEDGAYNLLEIKDGAAAVTDANCGDHTCVRTGAVSRSGQSIICLPHKVVVTVSGGAADGVDAVS